MEENNIILNEDFKSIILNKKVNARIMSLIEIIDNMILNQFFISYNEFLKDYLKNDGEPFELNIKENQKIQQSFQNCVNFYKKFLDGYFENKDVDKSELINGAIRHPFDMSGTDTFLRFFLSIEEQSNQEFCKNYFLKSLKSKLLLNFKTTTEFLMSLIRIKHLRNYTEHKDKLDSREQEIKFYEKNKKENKIKYSKIAITEFDLLKSLQTLFYFLPDIELSEFYQLIVAELTKEQKENENFRKNLGNIFANIKNKNRINTKLIMESLKESDKIKFQELKDKWKNRLIQKNLKLFEFIKMYDVIGNFNMNKIINILNTFAEKNKDNQFNITKNSISKITFEELYKIFHFFTGLNEIIRSEFVDDIENLNNYIRETDRLGLNKKLEELKNKIKNTNNKEDRKNLQTSIDENNKEINKTKAKSKLAEFIRNNIAHANLFFYTNNNKNYSYNKIFYLYLKEIIKFYNIKYNKNYFNDFLKKQNANETFNYKKAIFIKRVSGFLLRKDYLFLVVPKESKDKHDNISAKIEIQKLGISNENKNTKEAFRNIIKAKIKEILDNQNEENKIYTKKLRIGAKDIYGITVMKYKHYYYLKNILIKELNKVKIEDLKFQGKENLAKKYEKRLDLEKKNDKI